MRLRIGMAIGAVLLGLGAAGSGFAAPASGDKAIAILESHCVRCHGGEKIKGGLDLTTREALLRGGENGVAVNVGDTDAGLLLRSVRGQTDTPMPHKEKRLPDAEIAKLAEWVKAGTPYPARTLKAVGGATTAPAGPGGFAISPADRGHWAFQPVRAVDVPEGAGSPIDRFIGKRLAEAGLTLSPPADRTMLIRRVTLDLIGLPPTPAEVDVFVGDASPDAYERLIDRLLASPHYGERWGRHWLDLARFAETDGFEHDQARPHAWRYRDYVIRSFNADKPYDRFVREQIAGDELWPDDADARIATGFNLLGPDMVDSSDQVQRRHDTLNDMTDTAALTFLGLTMGCARCHDHKFEPLSQRDYYSLQAFFTPAKVVREMPIPSAEARAAYDAAMERFNQHPTVKELAALEAPVRAKLFEKRLAKLAPEARAAHLTPPDERTDEQANLAFETQDQVAVSDKDVATAIPAQDKDRRAALVAAVKKLPKPAELPKAMVLVDGKPTKTFVLQRGNYNQPGDEVRPGYPAVVASGAQDIPLPAENGRRAELAAWVASTDNPLTARVMVNRLWQHHFGRGLVTTPSDFGTHGQPPSHPELLDWLAGEFVARGWSVKQMHKLMLMSRTYQQSSRTAASEAARAADPENRLLWRMNRLRLEGEVIRDSLLAVSGRLNEKLGGPGVFPPLPEEVFKGSKGGWATSADPADACRRSVYIFARRNLRFPLLEVFDAPDGNLSCPNRERSTTAPQSLALLNAEEVVTAARATAARVDHEAKGEDGRVAIAYRLALGRPPSEAERAVAREFLGRWPLSEFCRALFNLNEFVYAE